LRRFLIKRVLLIFLKSVDTPSACGGCSSLDKVKCLLKKIIHKLYRHIKSIEIANDRNNKSLTELQVRLYVNILNSKKEIIKNQIFNKWFLYDLLSKNENKIDKIKCPLCKTENQIINYKVFDSHCVFG